MFLCLSGWDVYYINSPDLINVKNEEATSPSLPEDGSMREFEAFWKGCGHACLLLQALIFFLVELAGRDHGPVEKVCLYPMTASFVPGLTGSSSV